jgi:tRNA A-37 threonylcarbamoyl transferase component Bud32
MKHKILSQGAEAVLEKKDNLVIKKRIPKSYRIKEIDEKIRKLRTRGEARIIERASKVIPVPKMIKSDEKKKEIIMEFIQGERLSDLLPKIPDKEQKNICRQIGENVARLHRADIIHGDLTPSNMILRTKSSREINKFQKQIVELKKLNFPLTDYAVFGSGPLAVHGIRESRDIDIIVKPRLWKEISKKYPLEKKDLIQIGNVEVYKNWMPWIKNSNKLIENADIIEGIKFVKLSKVSEWKKKYNREKDKIDLELIENFLSEKENPVRLYFIDFGLGYVSHKPEDKAVDLHLLREAIEAGFADRWKDLFLSIKKGYSENYKDSKKILERFTAVERRGRYKKSS